MKLNSQCCKDCKKRHPGCHGECEDYINAKAEAERIRQKLIEQGMISGYFADTSRKKKKRYMKK